MKKSFFLFFALAVSAIFCSCKDNFTSNMNENEILEKQLYSYISPSYYNIGREHNKLLSDFYFDNEAVRVLSGNINYKEIPLEEYFGPLSTQYHIKNISPKTSRSSNEEEISVTKFMLDKELVYESSSSYIQMVESVLDEPLDSLEATQAAITKIELEALNEKSEGELCEFLSYAETAKASLDFWSENLEVLEIHEETNKSARWIFRRLWNRHKYRLAMMASSDAAGAAAGALVGFANGGPHGSVIGAAIAGSASSAAGFARNCVCVVIPFEKIMSKL